MQVMHGCGWEGSLPVFLAQQSVVPIAIKGLVQTRPCPKCRSHISTETLLRSTIDALRARLGSAAIAVTELLLSRNQTDLAVRRHVARYGAIRVELREAQKRLLQEMGLIDQEGAQ